MSAFKFVRLVSRLLLAHNYDNIKLNFLRSCFSVLLFSGKREPVEDYLIISRLFQFALQLYLRIALFYSTLSTTCFSFLSIYRQTGIEEVVVVVEDYSLFICVYTHIHMYSIIYLTRVMTLNNSIASVWKFKIFLDRT